MKKYILQYIFSSKLQTAKCARRVYKEKSLIWNMELILKEQDLINTYNKPQQEQCRLYCGYKQIKQTNQTFGYKRIAKLLGQPYYKTRWGHANKYKPVPIQTVEWLKDKRLLPFSAENPKIRIIARVLGSLFGDGCIDINHNMIFFSSSELASLESFKRDLIEIFGPEILSNFDIRKGGINNTSFCIRNNNRKVIRFFKALGAPVGNKTTLKLNVPYWILKEMKLQDLFFGSLFGNEIGIPKINIKNKGADSLDIGFVCKKSVFGDRINFLKSIQNYLQLKGIYSKSIYVSNHKTNNKLLVRLAINLNFDNLMNFHKNIDIYYSNKKIEKLEKTMNNLIGLKNRRFHELSNKENKLTGRFYSKEWIKNNLRLTDKSLNFILSNKSIEEWN